MTFDPSTFATRDAQVLQRQFMEKQGVAIARLCAGKLSEQQVKDCIMQAGLRSGWGRFVIGHNYWMLPGRGDAGCFLLVRVCGDSSSVSSLRPIVDRYAKFSNLPQAVDAWCRQRKRGS